MRILYCNKYNFAFSGTESYLFEAMDLMKARGHSTALFSMADSRGGLTDYDKHFVPHIDFKSKGQSALQQIKMAGHAIYSTDARKRLQHVIAEFRPDVAHVRNIYHHLSPSILWELRTQRVPVIYHVNDFKLLCPSYNLVSQGNACERCAGGKFRRILTEGCYPGSQGAKMVLAAEAYVHRWLKTYERCVDLFLAPSHFVKDKLAANGLDAARIQVLPHFQKLAVLPVPPLKPDSPILYFGRLSPEKGVADLIKAMRLVPEINLQIAGDGPQREELVELSRKLQLSNVDFLGHVKGADLDLLIASSRFSIFPSHAYETLGKSILESYAWNRTVVASDLGSRRELVRDGQTGLLFPVGNVKKLTEAISLLSRHSELAIRLGKEGRKLVRQNHSPEAHYEQLLAIYEKLEVKSRSPQPIETFSKRSSLRVAFIGGRGVVSKYSGIESYYEEVGRQLAGMGHKVTVFCRSYFTPPLRKHNGMHIVRLPAVRTKHLETLTHTLLSTLHAAFGPFDIVHYHALGPALFSFLPRLFGKKTVVTVQGLDWQRKKWGRFASSVLRLGEKASATLPNATMVVSHTLQQHYQTQHGVRTIYIPNGTVIRKQRSTLQVVRWGIETGNYILFLGRFSPEKNCHLLIEAYERIATEVKLVLAGGSSYSDKYAEGLRKHQSDRIRVLNWVNGADLEGLLAHAMLFVLPSDMEGLSLALLDAMGAGVCVLTSDVQENREVVDDAGFTFKRGDVDDLERMLRLLIGNPKLRQVAARAGQERVAERYLWRGIAESIDQTYRGLFPPNRFPKRRLAAVDMQRAA